MKFRRDLIIAVLATFCLTVTLFMVVTTKSADSPNWDPWADLREDGTVDIYDAIKLSNAFGSSGDTTKNVNVTDFPLEEFGNVRNLGYVNVSWKDNNPSEIALPMLSCVGYDEIYVFAWPSDAMYGVFNCSILLGPIMWMARVPSYGEGRWEFASRDQLDIPVIVNGSAFWNDFQWMKDTTAIKVKGPYCQLYIAADSPTTPLGWVQITVDVYLAKR